VTVREPAERLERQDAAHRGWAGAAGRAAGPGRTFAPALVPKQATRSDGLNAVIISLYAKGMSVRDIARHVRQTADVDLSPDTISRVTDAALEQMREWQHRPLEPFYPVIYIDALVAKVRDGRRCGTRRKHRGRHRR